MTDFQDRYNLIQGDSIVIIGPPGTGKSTFASSVCEVVPPERVKLLCAKPRERSSWGYRQYGLDRTAELFYNAEFRPSLDKWKAPAWRQLMLRLDELGRDDSVDVVILDPGTDAAMLAGQAILAKHKAASPRDLGNPYDYYTALKNELIEFVRSGLVALTYAAHPKFVIVPWHAQELKPSDESGKGITFEGTVLPAVEGSYRELLAGDFGLVLYSHVVGPSTRFVDGKPIKDEGGYRMLVRATKDEHVKLSSLPPNAFGTDEMVPNEFKVLYDKMIEGSE